MTDHQARKKRPLMDRIAIRLGILADPDRCPSCGGEA